MPKPTKLKMKLLSPKNSYEHPSYPKQGVCRTLALPFTLKRILRQKKNYGNSNISSCKNIVFKKSSKRNKNPSRYYNSTTNLKVSTQAKISSFKNPHIKIHLLPRGQNPLTYYTLL
jgi:hypothetical protein